MQSFLDTSGQRWTVEVTFSTLVRVKRETGHALLTLVEPDSALLRTLADDPVEMFAVFCALLRPQLERLQVTEEQLGERLNQQACNDMVRALLEALYEYFPEEKKRVLQDACRKALAAHDRLQREAIQRAETLLAEPGTEQAIEALVRKSLYGASPASSASIPDPTP